MPLSVLWGLVAGFVGAIIFLGVMAPMMRSGPGLMAYVAARALRLEPTAGNAIMGGMIFHLIYGTAMGGIFAWGATALTPFLAPLLSGVLFTILLFLLALFLIVPLARMPRMPLMGMVVFLLAHLVYGVILGSLTAFGSGVSPGAPLM